MTTAPARNLHDTEAQAGGDKKPDPSPPELALGAAAHRFVKAAMAVEEHQGPRSGPDYQAKVAIWRRRYAELIEAARPIPEEA